MNGTRMTPIGLIFTDKIISVFIGYIRVIRVLLSFINNSG